jgi:hypothetical protein
MARSRIPLALIVGAALLGCSTDKGSDPRTLAEMSAPSPQDWRTLAHELADDIARGAAQRGASDLAVLASVDGGAPAYFRELLLAELLERGLRITDTGQAPLRIECRTAPLGVMPLPRGTRGSPGTSPGEILVLCLLAHDGAFIAAAQRLLPVPGRPEPPDEGIVLEVTG